MDDRLRPRPPRPSLERPQPRVGVGGSRQPDPTRSIGFDETIVHALNGTSQAVGALFRWGPFKVYQAPPNINRAEIESLAVSMEPDAYALTQSWWTLQLNGGNPQEFVLRSELVDHATPSLVIAPGLVQGVRYTWYRALADPAPVRILLTQSERLELLLIVATAELDAAAKTLYIRVTGTNYYEV